MLLVALERFPHKISAADLGNPSCLADFEYRYTDYDNDMTAYTRNELLWFR